MDNPPAPCRGGIPLEWREFLMKRTKFLVLLVGLVFALAACGEPEENGENGDEGFAGGNFTVTVSNVDDSCFGGAMEVVILPTGEPSVLPAPVAIPSRSDLPADVDIQFNAPFNDVQGVPFEVSGANGLRTTGNGFEQNGVDIAPDGEECDVDMLVTAELIASDDDTFTGTGTLTVSSATGENCPAFDEGPPCTVTTTLTATRVE